MHPVPPDWALKGAPNPQETEDEKPDEKTPAMSKEGAMKADDEKEYFQDEKDNDNINEKDEEKKKRKLNNDNDSMEKPVLTGVIKLPQEEVRSGLYLVDSKARESTKETVGMEVVEEVVKEVVAEVEPKVSDIQTR